MSEDWKRGMQNCGRINLTHEGTDPKNGLVQIGPQTFENWRQARAAPSLGGRAWGDPFAFLRPEFGQPESPYYKTDLTKGHDEDLF